MAAESTKRMITMKATVFFMVFEMGTRRFRLENPNEPYSTGYSFPSMMIRLVWKLNMTDVGDGPFRTISSARATYFPVSERIFPMAVIGIRFG
jgi:hypothetical protein